MPSLVRPSLLHLDDEVDARFDVGMKLSALLREEEEAAALPWLPPAPEASGVPRTPVTGVRALAGRLEGTTRLAYGALAAARASAL